jgi:hypothetical protein
MRSDRISGSLVRLPARPRTVASGLTHSRKLHIEENTMPTRNASRSIRRRGLPLALAGVALLVAASGLGPPAAAQIMIGIGGGGGGGGIGLGGGGMMSAPQDASPPPSASRTEHRSRKAKSSKSDSDERRVKEATKAHTGGDTSSPSKGVDDTSFPTR